MLDDKLLRIKLKQKSVLPFYWDEWVSLVGGFSILKSIYK